MANYIRYYTKTEVRKVLKEKYNIDVTYVTLWNYEKKGYIKPSGFNMRGTKKMPIYTDKEIEQFISKVEKLTAKDKLRIRK